MSKAISLFDADTHEYSQLEKAAEMLTEKSRHGYKYFVADTWFNFGQDWSWTTILAEDKTSLVRTWQALSPAQQEEIINSEDLDATIDAIRTDKYWND